MSYLISIGKVVGKLLATLIAWALVLGYSSKMLNYLYPSGEGGANLWVPWALSIGAAVAAWWILSSGDSEETASSSIESQKDKNDDLQKHKTDTPHPQSGTDYIEVGNHFGRLKGASCHHGSASRFSLGSCSI